MKKKKPAQAPRPPAAQAPPAAAALPVRPRLAAYEALIFLTGAVTLSLEVLASRIMTPYFGVSLYIWAGILSITLIFLALGYQWGGRLTQRRDPETLQFLFLAAPLVAALAIVVAAALYPAIFPVFSTLNLIVASFLGGTLLLALPLVVLSAMNPLLIALARDAHPGGDGGAGRVFFISTVGSVAGVVLTAFLIIPRFTNYRALLWLSLGLSLVVVCLLWLPPAPAPARRRRLLAGGLVVVVLGGVLLVGQKAYFRMLAARSELGRSFAVLAEYTSVFGNIKVVAVNPEDRARPPALVYLQDGIIQNMVTADGKVLDHTGFMLRLIEAYAPAARDSLVLGMASGFIPQRLQDRGQKVTAVEINPNSLQAAVDFFKFDPSRVAVHIEDARTFVRRHRAAYDVVVTDLFHGDCTPDYLLTIEFFREVAACLRPGGMVIINTYFDPADEAVNETILATVAAAFPFVLEFRSPSSAGLVSSACMLASSAPLSPETAYQLAARGGDLPTKDYQTLQAVRPVSREVLSHRAPVSDDHNIFSILAAASQLRYRTQFNKLPPHLLVN